MNSDQWLTEKILPMYFSSPVNPLQADFIFLTLCCPWEGPCSWDLPDICCEEPQISVYNQGRASRDMVGDERHGTTYSERQVTSNSSCSTHLSPCCSNSVLSLSKAPSTACCINMKPKTRQKLLTCWPWGECGKLNVELSCLTFFYPLAPYCVLPCW